jgi:hypothetical protein
MTRIARSLARALAAVLAPAVLSAACNSESPSCKSIGQEAAHCKVRADCPGYVAGDAGAQGFVCLFGYCMNDPTPCTTLCSGNQRGLTCVHSGVRGICDGCTHDSACVSPAACEAVTGHPCHSDVDAGNSPCPWVK